MRREIARRTCASRGAGGQLTSIFEKLGVHSRAHAIVLAKDNDYGVWTMGARVLVAVPPSRVVRRTCPSANVCSRDRDHNSIVKFCLLTERARLA